MSGGGLSKGQIAGVAVGVIGKFAPSFHSPLQLSPFDSIILTQVPNTGAILILLAAVAILWRRRRRRLRLHDRGPVLTEKPPASRRRPDRSSVLSSGQSSWLVATGGGDGVLAASTPTAAAAAGRRFRVVRGRVTPQLARGRGAEDDDEILLSRPPPSPGTPASPAATEGSVSGRATPRSTNLPVRYPRPLRARYAQPWAGGWIS